MTSLETFLETEIEIPSIKHGKKQRVETSIQGWIVKPPDFDSNDLSTRSAYDVMEKEYGVTVVRAHQSLEPVVATEYEAELLGVEPGAPLMLERRLGLDENDHPVEYGKDLYRGDRFRFTTQLAPLET